MPDPLAAVRRAAVSRRRADEVYRAALAAARKQGCSYGQIAGAVGLSRQAVRQLLERGRST